MPLPPDVLVFTDGACSGNPGPGGWAAILRHPSSGRVKKLSGGDPATTNNRMELTAAIEGLRAIKDDQRRRVHLVSDSEYVLKGLTEWMPKWLRKDFRRGRDTIKNVDLWKTLHELSLKHDMSYEYVRGHSGHPENEECDRLAVAEIEKFRTQRW